MLLLSLHALRQLTRWACCSWLPRCGKQKTHRLSTSLTLLLYLSLSLSFLASGPEFRSSKPSFLEHCVKCLRGLLGLCWFCFLPRQHLSYLEDPCSFVVTKSPTHGCRQFWTHFLWQLFPGMPLYAKHERCSLSCSLPIANCTSQPVAAKPSLSKNSAALSTPSLRKEALRKPRAAWSFHDP